MYIYISLERIQRPRSKKSIWQRIIRTYSTSLKSIPPSHLLFSPPPKRKKTVTNITTKPRKLATPTRFTIIFQTVWPRTILQTRFQPALSFASRISNDILRPYCNLHSERSKSLSRRPLLSTSSAPRALSWGTANCSGWIASIHNTKHDRKACVCLCHSTWRKTIPTEYISNRSGQFKDQRIGERTTASGVNVSLGVSVGNT